MRTEILKVRSKADTGVPPMRNETDAMFLRVPGNSPLLAQAAALGDIRLNDVKSSGFQPWCKRLASGEYFPTRDRDASGSAKRDIICQRIRWEGFFEPMHVVIREHLSSAYRPFEIARPVGIARASVHHKQGIRPDRFTRGTNDRFVHAVAATPEWSPTNLECSEPLRLHRRKFIGHMFRFAHQ